MTFWQNSFRPIPLWFEVEFYNYFTGIITILRQRVACNISVATLKAKVTAWPFSKIVSGPKFCYLMSDFTTKNWQTTSLCPIPIRVALPGSDRLLFNLISILNYIVYISLIAFYFHLFLFKCCCILKCMVKLSLMSYTRLTYVTLQKVNLDILYHFCPRHMFIICSGKCFTSRVESP